MKAAVVGSGIGGLAIAIRLAVKGYKVTIFEKELNAGGKLNELFLGEFRFDTGPSLFTLPSLVDELFVLAKRPCNEFTYSRLDNVTRYFFANGKVLNSWSDSEKFAHEVEMIIDEKALHVKKYLKDCKELYNLTHNIFLFNPFPSWKGLLSREAFRILVDIRKLKAFQTMNRVNEGYFDQPETVQLFNRFATYNGSNPYRAPGTLTIIPHLEHNVGAFFPEKGIYSIVRSLLKLASSIGVQFNYNCTVQRIDTKRHRVAGLVANGAADSFDIVVNNTDLHYAYSNLLDGKKMRWLYGSQAPSSSAIIFYWGVKILGSPLELHNILFSNDYFKEFKSIESKEVFDDPTVYIYISSKSSTSDAPNGCENWFVMVNAPEDAGQNWAELTYRVRESVLKKIKQTLGFDIEPLILCEKLVNPPIIESQTGSYRGSLYGISSNSRFAAFSRHPNRLLNTKGLFFVGGSVHPGGGIPLCLASAKIVDSFITPA